MKAGLQDLEEPFVMFIHPLEKIRLAEMIESSNNIRAAAMGHSSNVTEVE